MLQKISLVVDDVNLEHYGDCEYDYVTLYDGPTENSTVINTFCTPNPSTFKSSGSSVLVVFISDGSVNNGNFSLNWTFVGACSPGRITQHNVIQFDLTWVYSTQGLERKRCELSNM